MRAKESRLQKPASTVVPRVVHLVPALFGEDGIFGGAERYAYELARAMAAVAPTTLVSFGKRAGTRFDDKLRISILGEPWYVRGQRTNPFTLGVIPELLRADVVHCHQWHIVATSAAAIVSKASRRKAFVTDLGGGGWDISAYMRTDNWFDAHLHISKYSMQLAQHPAHVNARVIYGGVDTQKFTPDPSVRRERAVLFVGRLLPHKGIDILIRAMAADVPLWIVGTESSPEYRADLHRLAQGKSVEFLHGLSDAEVVRLYQRAACIVLPSVYRTMYGDETLVPELLGQTLLEGMACGTPAICSDVASMPEVVARGRTGLVVPPNAPDALRGAISELLSNPQRAAELGRNARQHVLENFTWNVVVQRCLAAYGASTRQWT